MSKLQVCYYATRLLLTYRVLKALNDRAPSYLNDLIVRYFPNRAGDWTEDKFRCNLLVSLARI